MLKLLQGVFVEDKYKVAYGVVFLIVGILMLLSYCYIVTIKLKQTRVELAKMTIQAQNPKVIEKPVYSTKVVERIITEYEQSEPMTVILEKETSTESNGGKETIPITEGAQPTEHKWTAGISYDTDGDIGGILTRRIYKTFEAGIKADRKTAGILGSVKF